MTTTQDVDHSEQVLLGVFGRPRTMLERGEGCTVYDTDGNAYLDLLGGIAVNAPGHAHPALVEAVTEAAGRLIHSSNFFVTPAQVELADRLLALAHAPAGSKVFFTNSGTEAIEAAVKLSRRTGRTRIVAMENAFSRTHARCALADAQGGLPRAVRAAGARGGVGARPTTSTRSARRTQFQRGRRVHRAHPGRGRVVLAGDRVPCRRPGS